MRVKTESAAPQTPWRGLRLQRKCTCGGQAGASGECENCRQKRSADVATNALSNRRGHDFGQMSVRAENRAPEAVFAVGQLQPGKNPEASTVESEQMPLKNPQPLPGADAPQRMDTIPTAGPAITVTNGWANPGSKTDRTTVGIGELSSFVVTDAPGGSWKSADGKGKTNNSVSFQWTASAKGTNAITYTAADKSVSTVTMTTEVPSSLTGHNDKDLTYPAGTQGAGMDMTITVQPTTVSFQALEIMEGTCGPSAVTGYFNSHTPTSHDAAAGAGTWNQVGPANDVSDTADSNGYPSPWSKGSYTWAIPTNWRLNSAKTSTAFSKTSDQVATITGTDGTTEVTKLGANATPRKP